MFVVIGFDCNWIGHIICVFISPEAGSKKTSKRKIKDKYTAREITHISSDITHIHSEP